MVLLVLALAKLISPYIKVWGVTVFVSGVILGLDVFVSLMLSPHNDFPGLDVIWCGLLHVDGYVGCDFVGDIAVCYDWWFDDWYAWLWGELVCHLVVSWTTEKILMLRRYICLCFFRYDVVQCSTFVWLLGIETFSSRSSVLDKLFHIIAAFLQLPVFFSLRRFFMSLCILEDVVFFCRRREPLSAMLMYTWAGRNVGSGRFLVGLKGRYVWRRACKMKACSLNGGPPVRQLLFLNGTISRCRWSFSGSRSWTARLAVVGENIPVADPGRY